MEPNLNPPMIRVEDISKTYRVPSRPAGMLASLKSLLKPRYQDVRAVREVSFNIEAGAMVGLIGPNGAGKTTMLKMLAGLLHPSAGRATVAGHVPWQRHPDYLRRISMVMGNKSQMLWDIPPLDSFRVLGEIYAVPPLDYRRTLDELIDLLDMQELLAKPVRNLSLGERMKCELVASLLYRPSVLFLDEPTLGLDISMQLRLRRFLSEYNQRSGVTLILTSHYMADVQALCPRVILIHHGSLLYDGELKGLSRKLLPFKMLRITLGAECFSPGGLPALPETAVITETGANTLTLRVLRGDAPAITAQLLQSLPIADLTVEDPPIEAVIDQVYSGGAA
jgi:ABC-2 type transport system ATP-binding protein